MKKCWVLLFGIWLLVACGGTSQRPLAVWFSCEVAGDCNGVSFSGSMLRESVGTMTLRLEEPSSLCGMQVVLDGRAATLTLGDMRYTQEALPPSSAPSLLLSVLDDIFYKDSSGTLTVNHNAIQGKVDGYSYCATLDAESGYILSVEVADAQLSLRLLNVRKHS